MSGCVAATRTRCPAFGRFAGQRDVILDGYAGTIAAVAMRMPGYTSAMRAVWIEPNQNYLAERRRLGLDKKDEVWDGVLHMVPPPAYHHVITSVGLFKALTPIAERRGLIALPDGVGLFGAESDYRIPDGVLHRPDQVTRSGLVSAELVIEVLSAHDESRDKLEFYAARGVSEVWLVDPQTLVVEVYTLSGGAYVRVPTVANQTSSPRLGITLELTAGPSLALRDGESVHHVIR